MLSELGVVIELPGPGVQRCVDEVGIGFALRTGLSPRRCDSPDLFARDRRSTFFNILGPLANPARPSAAMIGCANLQLAPVMADVLAGRGPKRLSCAVATD